ncbi:MAG: hypothetical protein ACO1OB_13640 [Archangium sp.]
MNALRFAAKKQLVEDAVKRLETVSSAEVVCVVATESGRYDRAESLLAIVFALAGLVAADEGFHALQGVGSWAPTPMLFSGLGVVLGFVVGLLLGSYVHPLRRLLISRAEQREEVDRAADAAFTRSRITAVPGRTGVLIYVSLSEHRVVLMADEGVRVAVDGEFARGLIGKAVAGFKAGGTTEVLAALVDEIGRQLATRLPPVAGRANTLPDHLVLLHPR